MFCKYCGKKLPENSIFCSKCGRKLVNVPVTNNDSKEHSKDDKLILNQQQKDESINKNKKNIKISRKTNKSKEKNNNTEIKKLQKEILRNFFTQVFKKHSGQERKELLKIGLVNENTESMKITPDKFQPWFYSRIFLILFLAFLMFEICILIFYNSNLMPAVMLIGSLFIPFTLLTMYFELNIYKDISFFEVICLFILGGALSIVFTLFLDKLISNIEIYNDFGIIDAMITSIIEETGKACIVIIIFKLKKNLSVPQGLLIGGAVGAGFAVFESAGYAFNTYLTAHDYNTYANFVNEYLPLWHRYNYADSYSNMNFTIILRALLAIGGHASWAAIEGAAFAKTKKINSIFIQYFAICFLLHAIWDTSIPYVNYIKFVILCIVPWYVITRQLAIFISEKADNKLTNNKQ